MTRLDHKTALITGAARGISRAFTEAYELIVVQADGDNPAHPHDPIALQVHGEISHLFNQAGEAIPRAERHPLAEMKRPAAHREN